MTKNKLLAIIPHRAIYALLPLLLAGCKSEKPNTEAELANIDIRLEQIDVKLDSMQKETKVILLDSASRDPKCAELGKEIERHMTALKKANAPKDSTKRNRISKKIGKLRMDSIMHAKKLEDQIINMRLDKFRAIYAQQDSLRNRRAELMKIKNR